MTVYGGWDPGTFQAWSLNLFADIFTSPGIARGFQVTQTATPSMAVQVNLDATAQDAVAYMPNGAWMRLDAVTTFSIGANTSGSTRTDALVANVDPTNSVNLSLAIQANWASGFTSQTNNQLVIALISVANNATSIVNANITMTSSTAKLTNAGGSSNSMTASDGIGLTVQDNSTSATLSVVLTGLTTAEGRAINIQTTDTSSIGHQYAFDTHGNFTAPGSVVANGIEAHSVNPASQDDSVIFWDRNNVQGGSMGWNYNGGGFFMWDAVNGGYMFNQGTKNGVQFYGTVKTTGNFSAPFYSAVITGSGNNWETVMDMPVFGTPTANINWRWIYDGSTGNFFLYDVTHGRTVISFSNAGLLATYYNGTSGNVAQITTNGGGAAGLRLWVGTTDPGALAGEGDIWVQA